jgi:SAM-dependent methyltransferase
MENISFYNEIAGNYDAMMEREGSNDDVRRRVAEKFRKEVPVSSRVLDFGGGTGGDLAWLIHDGYHVLFCEPSEAMKEQAINRFQNLVDGGVAESLVEDPVHGKVEEFLDGMAVDFTSWRENLPFAATVDAILANFAVLNNISDIELLFRNLALVLKSGGSLVALVLRPKLRHELRSWAGLPPDTREIRYNERLQSVHIHSQRAIRKASAANFHFCGKQSLAESGFLLIHLTRK